MPAPCGFAAPVALAPQPPALALRRSAACPTRSARVPARRGREVPRLSADAPRAAADAAHMRRCVALARTAGGQTRPNPLVGCVIVTPAGVTLAEGFHTRAGRRHAEAEALHAAEGAGVSVAGATAYVSLEPCNHTGRTPPCAAALVRAGVARVVVGMVDPDPRTAGGGIARMRAAGIEVDVGVEEEACRRLNEGFVTRVEERMPFGALKYAMTLDGKIATETGSSKWVTGPAARARVHEIRNSVDAIIIGGETLRKDDARLTVRLADGGAALDSHGETRLAPIRVVMTRTLDLPRDARMWSDAHALRTVVLTVPGHGRAPLADHLRSRGVEVHEVAGLRPRDAMRFLYDQDALSVLWECGGGLAAAAIADGCVKKVHAFIAPKIVGGGGGAPTPVAGPALAGEMGDALVLRDRTVEQLDGDVLVSGYL
jgi:diaminohydroxyphosphoribosylaminopyrimidine deaminase / 5-amino-6-(5-phosphoribosylamino)uracil reductase